MQIENHKEEVPFAHYCERFAALDPQEAAARTGTPFENGAFRITLLGHPYRITHPEFSHLRRGRHGPEEPARADVPDALAAGGKADRRITRFPDLPRDAVG